MKYTFFFYQMPLAGLEPARCYPLDFESSASANSATAAHEPIIILTQKDRILQEKFLKMPSFK